MNDSKDAAAVIACDRASVRRNCKAPSRYDEEIDPPLRSRGNNTPRRTAEGKQKQTEINRPITRSPEGLTRERDRKSKFNKKQVANNRNKRLEDIKHARTDQNLDKKPSREEVIGWEFTRSSGKNSKSNCVEGEDANNSTDVPNILYAQRQFWALSGLADYPDESVLQMAQHAHTSSSSTQRAKADLFLSDVMNDIDKELLSIPDGNKIIQQFNAKHKAPRLISCGCCGEREYDGGLHVKTKLEQLDLLKLTQAEEDEWEKLGIYKPVASVYVSNTEEKYYLHPETIQDSTPTEPLDEKYPNIPTKNCDDNRYVDVILCSGCHVQIMKGVIPQYSIKNKHDYGDIRRLKHVVPHLEPLSLAESHLIGKYRMYGSIIKYNQSNLSKRTLKGHIISFAHDGPQQMMKVLPCVENVLENIQVSIMQVISSSHVLLPTDLPALCTS